MNSLQGTDLCFSRSIGSRVFYVLLFALLFGSGSSLSAQDSLEYAGLSIEIEPGFAFVKNREVPERNFGVFGPLTQLNYQVGRVFEPHLRLGYISTYSHRFAPIRAWSIGVGTRVHFAHFIRFRDEWTRRNVRLFLFVNYSRANYSIAAEEFFYRLKGLEDHYFRTGVGFSIPIWRRFWTKIELGYARRSHSRVGLHGRVAASSIIYRF